MQKNSKILKKREKIMQKYRDKINAKISRKKKIRKLQLNVWILGGQTENLFWKDK